jgi:predicted AAA+ superfamily ATPase
MSELKRNSESKLNTLLNLFPAVAILGVRQCGKTTLSKKLRPTWRYLDLEHGPDYDLIHNDPSFFFKENPTHIIFDEAQLSADLFKELRVVIDQNRQEKNRFILTGSSSPELIKSLSESLAGRCSIIELGTLTCNEYYQKNQSDFYTLFTNPLSPTSIQQFKSLKPTVSFTQLQHFFLKGGYPEPSLSSNPVFYDAWMKSYFQTYIERDVRKLFPRLELITYRRMIRMLSELSGREINKSMLGRSLNTSEVSIGDYLDIAEKTFVWRMIYPLEKSLKKSMIKRPKGIFRDSGLQHYLANIKKTEQLSSYPAVGFNFEAYVIEEILKGLDSHLYSQWNYSYLRSKNGFEIDLILSGDFGIIPIEIKYGIRTKSEQLRHLKQFIKDYNAPFGIIINNANQVELLAENIVQVPANFL